MRGCTLEELECSYSNARLKAEEHTRGVLKYVKKGSSDWHGAIERLSVIEMMDEMYGAEGDHDDGEMMPTVVKEPLRGEYQMPESNMAESKILEEIVQLKETFSVLMSGSVGTRITGPEATILSKKKTSELVGGGHRVFPISDTASEADIKRWLDHPGMDGFADTMVVSMASHTNIPTKMMEEILKRLLQGEYERLYHITKERVKQRHERKLDRDAHVAPFHRQEDHER